MQLRVLNLGSLDGESVHNDFSDKAGITLLEALLRNSSLTALGVFISCSVVAGLFHHVFLPACDRCLFGGACFCRLMFMRVCMFCYVHVCACCCMGDLYACEFVLLEYISSMDLFVYVCVCL